MCDEGTLPGCRIHRCFDVVDEPVRPNDRLLRIPQGTAHTNAAAIRQPSRPRSSKKPIGGTKLGAVCSLISSTNSVYIRSHNLQVVNFHSTLSLTSGALLERNTISRQRKCHATDNKRGCEYGSDPPRQHLAARYARQRKIACHQMMERDGHYDCGANRPPGAIRQGKPQAEYEHKGAGQ